MESSRRHLLVSLAISALAGACGPQVGGIIADRWLPLAEGTWSLEPGTENSSWCQEIVVREETYISAVRPIAPPGTHHVAVNLASSDGGADCGAERLGPETVYAANAGSGEIRLPTGVAMRLHAGQALQLALHIFNPSDVPLDGTSGVEVVRAKPEDVKQEAGFVLAGPEQFSLPPRQRTTVTQTCSFGSSQILFSLIPLMHDLGVAFKTTLTRGNESSVLYDGAFQFQDQSQLSLGALAVNEGDSMLVECTFDNPKYIYVTHGHDGGEICYGALLRSPADASMTCPAPDAPADVR